MSKYNYVIPAVIVGLIIALAILRLGPDEIPEHSDSRILMDTFVEIRIWGEGEVSGEAAVDSAFAVIASIDSLLGDGIVTAGETSALGTPVGMRLMEISESAFAITEGLFDPTIGAVSRLWEFYSEASPPDADSVRAVLGFVGLREYLSAAGGGPGDTPDRGYTIDIGGVAKGYALDLAAARIESLGFRAAILNAGGDIKIVDEKPGGGKWRIAVRHPRRRDAFLGCLEVGPTSIATSGDYERSFEHHGTRYHHILDPRTGWPSPNSVSVTVMGRDAGLCDALATGLFVMGGDEALSLAESLPGIDAVFVSGETLDVETTSGISDSFERLE